MSENDKGKMIRNEILAGLTFGTAVGIIIAIAAFLSLNIWFLLFIPVNSSLALLTIAVVWIFFVMSSTLYYKPFRWAIYRNLAFSAGLFISISLMNYAYNILAYDILPYSSLRTIKIIAFILIGSGIGMMIKIIIESKRTEKEQKKFRSRI